MTGRAKRKLMSLFDDLHINMSDWKSILPGKAATAKKTEINASVDLSDLLGYSGESTKLMNQAFGVLMSRMQDMLNAILPDECQVIIEWDNTDSFTNKEGKIRVRMDGDRPDYPGLVKMIEELNTNISVLSSAQMDLEQKVSEERSRAEGAEKAVAEWERLYKSDPVSSDETPERTIDLG